MKTKQQDSRMRNNMKRSMEPCLTCQKNGLSAGIQSADRIYLSYYCLGEQVRTIKLSCTHYKNMKVNSEINGSGYSSHSYCCSLPSSAFQKLFIIYL